MTKPHPAAVAAVHKVGGIVQGLAQVAQWFGRPDDGEEPKRDTIPAPAPAPEVEHEAPRPRVAGHEAEPCPRVKDKDWACLLHAGHRGDCIEGRR